MITDQGTAAALVAMTAIVGLTAMFLSTRGEIVANQSRHGINPNNQTRQNKTGKTRKPKPNPTAHNR